MTRWRLPRGAAKLTIIGNCTAARCIISGEGAYPVFTSPSSNPPGGVLTLVNLNFQRAAGGVFFNVQTAINASKCGFVRNMAPSGGVLSACGACESACGACEGACGACEGVWCACESVCGACVSVCGACESVCGACEGAYGA
ncbi:unnamed protein product [Closterium sp. Naga37s-1]|nr:unnamed protein product [Closterium sp. Naga37s-1]